LRTLEAGKDWQQDELFDVIGSSEAGWQAMSLDSGNATDFRSAEEGVVWVRELEGAAAAPVEPWRDTAAPVESKRHWRKARATTTEDDTSWPDASLQGKSANTHKRGWKPKGLASQEAAAAREQRAVGGGPDDGAGCPGFQGGASNSRSCGSIRLWKEASTEEPLEVPTVAKGSWREGEVKMENGAAIIKHSGAHEWDEGASVRESPQVPEVLELKVKEAHSKDEGGGHPPVSQPHGRCLDIRHTLDGRRGPGCRWWHGNLLEGAQSRREAQLRV